MSFSFIKLAKRINKQKLACNVKLTVRTHKIPISTSITSPLLRKINHVNKVLVSRRIHDLAVPLECRKNEHPSTVRVEEVTGKLTPPERMRRRRFDSAGKTEERKTVKIASRTC
jgi:hypothetical protein